MKTFKPFYFLLEVNKFEALKAKSKNLGISFTAMLKRLIDSFLDGKCEGGKNDDN